MTEPGTRKDPLEKLTKKLEKEVEIWNELGMNLENTVHSPSSIYALKMQMQTLINLLLEKGIATNEEFNIEFKTLILNDMQRMRAVHEPQIREERRQAIVHGVKKDIAVPEIRVIGPDGRDLKI